uniref:Transcription elongation factor A N-terminal and central domain containing n=1 Tax=Scophthalmus maximus TaxID=52904 RepID=A0A8D3D5A5_SCOMX
MDAREIIQCVRQMEKFTADRHYGDILTLLGDLDRSQVTAEQLEMTDIVKVLYMVLKTCSDGGVKKTVKGLLSKWKRQYTKEARGGKCSGDRRVSDQGGSHSGSSQAGSRQAAAEQEALSTSEKDDLRTLTSTAENTSASSDFPSVRAKCAQLLLAALSPNAPDQDAATQLAGDIEHHVHERHKSSRVKYKTCVRSKVANLRNPKNGHLCQGLLSGSLSPEAFARMSAEEMAGAELRQLREEFSSRGVSERQLPQAVEGTQTQKICCKRCGGSDCRVTQVRGAPDEDAMTFVTCSGCGQQWYHSLCPH